MQSIRKQSNSFEEILIEKHKDKNYALLSLQEALLAEDEPRLLNITLDRIIRANGGYTEVSRLTGIVRESLYQTVSLKNSPKVHVLFKILTALGIPFFQKPKQSKSTRSGIVGTFKVAPKNKKGEVNVSTSKTGEVQIIRKTIRVIMTADDKSLSEFDITSAKGTPVEVNKSASTNPTKDNLLKTINN